MIGFLFARQRSGTGALGSVLDRHPGLKYVGEVLHPEDQANDANFFRYINSNRDVAAAFADPKRKIEVIKEYRDWLVARYAPRMPIVDIKYRSLHNWNGAWQGLVERPWLINHIIGNAYPVIHMKRGNFLETYVSGRLAELNHVWHARSVEEVKVKSTVIDIKQMSRYLSESAEEVRLIDTWLKGYKNRLEIEYAAAFDESGNLDRTLASRMQSVFKLATEFSILQPTFVKQAPASLAASITNIDDVERSLSGTGFEWMLGK